MTHDARNTAIVPAEGKRVRIDKWLWAARFYRTRGLAAEALDAGHVRLDGERVKIAHPVRAGSRITVRKRELTWDIEVLDISERRGPASDAALLYRETTESAAARERMLDERRNARAIAAPSRPTKRDRRKLEDFLNEP
jgi:ribosome-associated heat shock protein Hsp15